MADKISDEHKIKLINFVQTKTYLWVPEHPDYRDRNKKTLAFEKLREELELGTDIDLLQVWNSLRHQYTENKRRKQRKSGSAATVAPRWKFFTMLRFLDGSGTNRETSSNMPPPRTTAQTTIPMAPPPSTISVSVPPGYHHSQSTPGTIASLPREQPGYPAGGLSSIPTPSRAYDTGVVSPASVAFGDASADLNRPTSSHTTETGVLDSPLYLPNADTLITQDLPNYEFNPDIDMAAATNRDDVIGARSDGPPTPSDSVVSETQSEPPGRTSGNRKRKSANSGSDNDLKKISTDLLSTLDKISSSGQDPDELFGIAIGASLGKMPASIKAECKRDLWTVIFEGERKTAELLARNSDPFLQPRESNFTAGRGGHYVNAPTRPSSVPWTVGSMQGVSFDNEFGYAPPPSSMMVEPCEMVPSTSHHPAPLGIFSPRPEPNVLTSNFYPAVTTMGLTTTDLVVDEVARGNFSGRSYRIL